VSFVERVAASPNCRAVQTGVTGFAIRQQRKGGDYFVTVLAAGGYNRPIGTAFAVEGDAITRMFVAGLVTVAGLVASVGMAGAAEPVGRYAIVVWSDVAAGPWGKVVRSLEAKYKGKAFAYDKSPVAHCLLLVGASTATGAPPTLPAVTAPPKELGLDPFYELSVAVSFGNLPSSPAYLSLAFLKAGPLSMNFRC
jgi:hypothetical protein